MTLDIFAEPQQTPGTASRTRTPGMRLFDALPEAEQMIPASERELARRAVALPVRTLPAGPLVVPPPAAPAHPFAWLVRDGVVLRRTGCGERSVAEMLGTGELIDVALGGEAASPAPPGQTELVAHEAVTVAVLDDRFRLAARRWPGLHEVVREHQVRQHRQTCRHLAVLALPRVEDRIVAVLSDLAERWGRVTPAGIRMEVRLTHSLLGELVASRRPTVSLALAQLTAQGIVTRPTERTWILRSAAAAA
jgi:CRP/FNR family cyclic AMP-dependent transcriptional regulator